MLVTSYGRNKNRDDEKKHSRTSPDAQFKEFSLTKQKLDQEWTMSELKKPFLKNQIKNEKKKQKIKMPHVNKNHYRETECLFKHHFLTLL